MDVSVVLVTWNSAPYLRRCLEGIRGLTEVSTELIVVDNASTDGSVALVAPHAQEIVRNDTNRGFSAAVNQAIRVARGEFLLLVNPDCYLQPDYAARLVAAMREAGADFGSATGLLLRAVGWDIEPTHEIDSAGIRMTRSGRHLDRLSVGGLRLAVETEDPDTSASDAARSTANRQPPTANRLSVGGLRLAVETEDPETFTNDARRSTANRQPPTANRCEVFGVSGAAAMYRMAFLHDVAIDGEVFDEDFFAYREDADLAWRGRLFGWRSLCEPAAIAYHVRRVTPDVRRTLPASINMHSVKNRFLLRIKNEGAYLALRNAPFELGRDLIVLAAALTIERSSLPAFAWLWRNRRRLLARRRAIQRRRKVSDRELARWFR